MARDVTDEYCGSDLDDETNDEAATDSDDDEDLNYTDDDYTDDSDNDDDDDYKLVAVVDKKSSKFVSQKVNFPFYCDRIYLSMMLSVFSRHL